MAEPAERVPYKDGGIALAVGKRFQVELQAPVLRARLTGILFDTSKSFLLPPAIHGIRALKRLFDEHKDLKVLIVGHTDRAGSDEYNLKLSGERAGSISSYLRDAVDEWMKFYGPDISPEKRWGANEDSLMIGQVVPAEKLEGGSPPPLTRANVEAFQRFSNETRGTSLEVDGKLGTQSRRALVAAYMAQPGTSLPQGVVPLTHGCGPFHNEVPTPPGVAEARNRRAEIFFFEREVNPPPRKRCPAPDGCPEHAQWLKSTNKTIDLDRGVGTLTVKVKKQDGGAIEAAAVHLEGPFSEDGKTDGSGAVAFADLPAGSYTVSAEQDSFEDARTTAELGDGSQVEADLVLQPLLFDLEVLVEDKSTPPNKLEKATVTIDAPGASPQATDANGLARFTGLPKGTFKLTATHERFEAGTVSVDVPFRAPPPPDSKSKESLVSAPGEAAPPPNQNGPVVALNAATVQLTIELLPLVPEAPDFKNPQLALGDGTRATRRAAHSFALSLPAGTHVLKVDPDPTELSTGVADLATGSRIATSPAPVSAPPPGAVDAYKAQPQFLLRPFEVEIEVDAGGLKRAAVKPPAAGVPPHATVLEAKGLSLRIDWRPDWFKRLLQFDASGAKTTPNTAFFRRQKQTDAQGRPTGDDRIDLLVLHQTSTDSTQSSFRTLALSDTSGVSAHFLVCTDGHVIKLVHQSMEVVHGDGFWQLDTGFALNDRSIGIEIAHGDAQLTNPHPFTPEQYASLVRLLNEIHAGFPEIAGSRVVAHSDIEPPPRGEKENDPGRLFEWHKLPFVRKRNRSAAAAMVQKPFYGIDTGGTLDTSNGDAVAELQEDLAAIGYLVLKGQVGRPALGDDRRSFGPLTQRFVKRFQVRFLSYDPDQGDPPAASWPSDAQARRQEFDKFKARFSGNVDFATAEAIKQVLADGPPAIRRFRTRDGKAPFARPGQSLQLAWFLEGDVRSARIEPGGIDALALTHNGRGSTTVQALEKDAQNGVVTFILSLVPGAPVKLGLRDGERDAPAPSATATSAGIQVPMTHNIPARDPARALSGSAFMEDLKKKNLDAARIDAREAAVLEQMKAGGIPDFMRNFIAVDCPAFNGHTGTIFVSPDYLAVGTDDDFVRFPLKPRLAQQIQDLFDTTFPTRKIVDILIGAGNAKKLALPEQVAEATNASYLRHNQRIEDALQREGTPVKRDRLVVGHKKDIILSPLLLNPAPADLNKAAPHGSAAVIIYGAIKGDKQGNPTSATVQPESDVHAFFYEDYSHGIRLVSKNMLVDGAPAKLFDVLHDKDKSGLVAGAFEPRFPTRYPTPPPPPPRVEKFGAFPSGGRPQDAKDSLQAAPGTRLIFAWEVDGTIDSIIIDNGVGAVGTTSGEKADVRFDPPAGVNQVTFTLTAASGGQQATRSVTIGRASGDKVRSSRITVGGKPFVDFYNGDLLAADRALPADQQVYAGSLGHRGAVMHGIGAITNAARFKDLFDNHLQDLTGKSEITINEFLAFFFIIMNEVGGAFTPADEHNKDFVGRLGKQVESLPGVVDDAYFFEARGPTHEDNVNKIDGNTVTRVGRKDSYNLIGLKAGDQLAGRTPGKPAGLSASPVISSQADVEAWNRTDRYPHDQPIEVRRAARECDFYKLRGRGLNQVTGRANYEGTVNPVLRQARQGKTFDELTEHELSEAFKDPAIYIPVSKNFFKKFQGAAMTQANADPPDFHAVGLLQAGSTATDYAELFHQRCARALEAMRRAGFTTS